MTELLHRIKVFVYRLQGTDPDYLLLRHAGFEGLWGPIQGPIGFGEKLESAIRREVMDEIGIRRPMDLIDLQMPSRWLLGDEEVIEWTFGFRVPSVEGPLNLGAALERVPLGRFLARLPDARARRRPRGDPAPARAAARRRLIRSQDQTHQIPRNWDPASSTHRPERPRQAGSQFRGIWCVWS